MICLGTHLLGSVSWERVLICWKHSFTLLLDATVLLKTLCNVQNTDKLSIDDTYYFVLCFLATQLLLIPYFLQSAVLPKVYLIIILWCHSISKVRIIDW